MSLLTNNMIDCIGNPKQFVTALDCKTITKTNKWIW